MLIAQTVEKDERQGCRLRVHTIEQIELGAPALAPARCAELFGDTPGKVRTRRGRHYLYRDPSFDFGKLSSLKAFGINADVSWHDGKPFTADDCVFTWEFARDPETASLISGSYKDAVVEKIDDYTFTQGFWICTQGLYRAEP